MANGDQQQIMTNPPQPADGGGGGGGLTGGTNYNVNAPTPGADINSPGGVQFQGLTTPFDTPNREPPQSYIPYPLQRTMSEIGKPDFIRQGMQNYPGVYPGPYAPQPGDVRGLVKSIGMGLGGTYGMPGGLMMMRYYLGFMKGRMQGQQFQAEMLHQQYANQSEKLELDVQQRLLDYGEIFDTYGTENPQDKQNLLEALKAKAHELGDHTMEAALGNASDPIGAAQRNLNRLDDLYSGLSKLNSQRSKAGSKTSAAAEKQAETHAISGFGGVSGAAGETQAHAFELQPDPKAPKPPPGAPQQQADQDEVTQRLVKAGMDPKMAASYKTAAWNMQQGTELPSGTDPDEVNAVNQYQLDMQKRLQDITHDGSLKTQQQVLDAVRKVYAPAADTLDNMLNYREGWEGSAGGNSVRAASFRTLMTNLAMHASNNQWDENRFGELHTYRTEFRNPNGKAQLTFQAAARMLPLTARILGEVNRLEADGSLTGNVITNEINKIWQTNFTDDERFRGLMNMMNDWNQEVQNVTGGGVARASITLLLHQQNPVISSPGQLRQMMRNGMIAARGRYEELDRSYQQEVARPGMKTPGFNPDIPKAMDAIDKMNVHGGKFDGKVEDLPEYLRPIAGGVDAIRAQQQAATPTTPAPTALAPGDQRLTDPQTGKSWIKHTDGSFSPG